MCMLILNSLTTFKYYDELLPKVKIGHYMYVCKKGLLEMVKKVFLNIMIIMKTLYVGYVRRERAVNTLQ